MAIKGHPNFFGPTGKFPRGKLNDSDEGELMIAVRFDDRDGLVHVDFGTEVKWLAMPPENAIALAKVLLEKAGSQ